MAWIAPNETSPAAGPAASADSPPSGPALNGSRHLSATVRAPQAVDETPLDCRVERRQDGSLLVRVPPRRQASPPLPDAVFAFRLGDPQYAKWLAQYESQSGASSR